MLVNKLNCIVAFSVSLISASAFCGPKLPVEGTWEGIMDSQTGRAAIYSIETQTSMKLKIEKDKVTQEVKCELRAFDEFSIKFSFNIDKMMQPNRKKIVDESKKVRISAKSQLTDSEISFLETATKTEVIGKKTGGDSGFDAGIISVNKSSPEANFSMSCNAGVSSGEKWSYQILPNGELQLTAANKSINLKRK